MSKVIKQMQMDALKKDFTGVRDMVLLNIVGLDAIAENQVRLGLRKKGIRLQLVKNSLALAEKIELLLRDPLLQKTIGTNGFETVKDKFSIQCNIDGVESLFKKYSQSCTG